MKISIHRNNLRFVLYIKLTALGLKSAFWFVVYVLLCDHGLRGSASTVLTATGLVNGKWQFLTPYRIDNPEAITKNVTGDYVDDPYSCAKFDAHPSTGGLQGEWVKYTL